ncbi:MAG: alkaline phosphatase family protein [Anaerolineae bacterium]|nr:alkaline phosphatase family protein [Anaerolineae bacterium]
MKALIIGLDGATFNVIDPLIEAGKLPNLDGLIRRGVHGALRSTIPPLSGAAWVSFMTGKQPGKHGILGFSKQDLNEYDQPAKVVRSDMYAGYTVFDILSQRGLRVSSYRTPMTYPTWPVNGEMVAGYPTPDRQKAFTYPPELAEQIGQTTLLSNDGIRGAGVDGELQDAHFQMGVITRYATGAIRSNRFDLISVVSNISDGFQHRFWKYYDPSHPCYTAQDGDRWGDTIEQGYRMLDEMVGALLSDLDDEWVVCVVSDHGAGPRSPWQFNTNAWLRKQGWLRLVSKAGGRRAVYKLVRRVTDAFSPAFKKWIKQYLPNKTQQQVSQARQSSGLIDWAQTRAYRVPLYSFVEGIHLNVVGRQPSGCVSLGDEYEELRDAVMSALRQVRDPKTGQPIVEHVWRREEVYNGPHLDQMPDIVFSAYPQYAGGSDIHELVSPTPRSILEHFGGDHTMDGIFILSGPGVQEGIRLNAQLIDVVPTILYSLDQPVPEDMDGKVLLDAFSPAYTADRPIHYAAPVQPDHSGDMIGQELSPQEEADIMENLRGLGYVG